MPTCKDHAIEIPICDGDNLDGEAAEGEATANLRLKSLINDDSWQQFVAHKDAEAFSRVVRAYHGLVYSVCRRVLGPRGDDIEDAVQETFCKLAANSQEIKTNFSGWLYSCALNSARSAVRQRVRRQQREANWSTENELIETETRPELASDLDDALQALDEVDRILIVEHFLVGRSQTELAAQMQITPSAVNKRLSRSLDKLRLRLTQVGLTMSTSALHGSLGASSAEAALTNQAASQIASNAFATTFMTSSIGSYFLPSTKRLTAKVCLISGAILAVVAGLALVFVNSQARSILQVPQDTLAPTDAVDDKSNHQTAMIRARFLDSQTLQPLEGVRFSLDHVPTLFGLSDREGMVEIASVPMGRQRFVIDLDGYARWWTDAAPDGVGKRRMNEHGWQRNFDPLRIEVTADIDPLDFYMERAATVSGRVVDPDGRPVVFATVAPVLSGTGNSITGDTRFSAATYGNGEFTVSLPASGETTYNLAAHVAEEKWANGVSRPFATQPGEVVEGIEITLTQPATIRGRIVDGEGRPVAEADVFAHRADGLGHRYFDPQAKTDQQGKFVLRRVEPGLIVVNQSYFLSPKSLASRRASQTVTAIASETTSEVELIYTE